VVRIRGRNVVIPSHDPNVTFSFTFSLANNRTSVIAFY
jgi:hypothetical protein